MEKSESIKELAAALSAAQGEMPAVPMGSRNPFLKNKYANLGDVIKTAFPVLARHGLSVSQAVLTDGPLVGVETILMHGSGEWLMSAMWSSVGEEKGLSNLQVAGKAITYLRRYTLSSVLGVYADEDADGSTIEEKNEKTKTRYEPAKTPAPANPDLEYTGPVYDFPETEEMSLEYAKGLVGSDNISYGVRSNKQLEVIAKNAKAPDERRRAAQMILDSRAKAAVNG
jgi:hypothetical protein